jgi:heat shock protein HslJ
MRHRLLPAACALVLAACSLLPGGDLEGAWRLTSGSVDGQAIPLPAPVSISLKLTGTDVSGSSGCNGYGGSMQVNGDRISFGSLSQTDMGCPEPLATAERLFMGALARVERGSRDGARLRLSGQGVDLAFARIVPTPNSPLIGVLWRLDTIVDGGTAMSTVGSDQATLQFGDDGQVRGSTACHDFVAAFSGAAASASIQPVRPASNGCGGPFGEIEQAVLATMGSGATAHVEQDRLVVDGPNGRGLVYRAVGAGSTDAASPAAARRGDSLD